MFQVRGRFGAFKLCNILHRSIQTQEAVIQWLLFVAVKHISFCLLHFAHKLGRSYIFVGLIIAKNEAWALLTVEGLILTFSCQGVVWSRVCYNKRTMITYISCRHKEKKEKWKNKDICLEITMVYTIWIFEYQFLLSSKCSWETLIVLLCSLMDIPVVSLCLTWYINLYTKRRLFD